MDENGVYRLSYKHPKVVCVGQRSKRFSTMDEGNTSYTTLQAYSSSLNPQGIILPAVQYKYHGNIEITSQRKGTSYAYEYQHKVILVDSLLIMKTVFGKTAGDQRLCIFLIQ